MAEIALAKQDGEEAAFYKAKLATARFFMQRILPQTGSLSAQIMAGGKVLKEMEEAAF